MDGSQLLENKSRPIVEQKLAYNLQILMNVFVEAKRAFKLFQGFAGKYHSVNGE